MVNAVNELGLAQAQVILAAQNAKATAIAAAPPGATSVSFELRDEVRGSRIDAATQMWRQALAEVHLYGDAYTSKAMEALDARRDLVVKAVLAGTFDIAERENDALRTEDSIRIYRLLQLMKIKREQSFIDSMRVVMLRMNLRRVRDQLIVRHNEIVAEMDATETSVTNTPGVPVE
ncbi:hypothetical protein WJX64_02825 [Leifsonia sp. YIM 134122]|uniref:Uncharacterized protein n=1 Tax=Leifsonia stereocauli TaxID=3134136 RepID=A0ABU9W3J2_9MICO